VVDTAKQRASEVREQAESATTSSAPDDAPTVANTG
jgi:hypothetical protein